MFRKASIFVISLLILFSSCSPLESATSIVKIPTEGEGESSDFLNTTPSEPSPLSIVWPTLDPYCDYFPSFDDNRIISDIHGPNRATGQTDQHYIDAEAFYSSRIYNTLQAFLAIYLNGDCRIKSFLIPLGLNTEIEWISIEDGIISVDIIRYGNPDNECCPTLQEKVSIDTGEFIREIIHLGNTDEECCPITQETKRYNTAGQEIIEIGVTPTPVVDLSGPLVAKIEPKDIQLNSNLLYSSWRVIPVESGSAPFNLPNHFQVSFDGKTKSELTPQSPIGFIIPLEEYLSLLSPETSKTERIIEEAYNMAIDMPDPPPKSNLPALPLGWIKTDYNLLAIGVDNELGINPNLHLGNFTTGISYLGYFGDPNSLINDNWYYIYQGFSDDMRYFFSIYHPVTSVFLSNLDQNQLSDGTISDQNVEIIDFLTSQVHMARYWYPSLKDLDSIAASLTVEGMEIDPLRGTIWRLQGGNGTVFAPTGDLCKGQIIENNGWSKTACDLSTLFDGTEHFYIESSQENVLTVSTPYSHDSLFYWIENQALDDKLNFSYLYFPGRKIDAPHNLFRYLMGCLSGEFRLLPLGDELELVLHRACTNDQAYLLFSKHPFPNR